MRFLFRACLVFIAFLIALSIIKFLFVKLFVLALWVGAIVLAIYFLSALFKKASAKP